MEQAVRDRFWSNVKVVDECWQWDGCLRRDGYGYFGVGGGYRAAHRVSYEIANGPINAGMFIDHKCHNKACVNPKHLREVTKKQNAEHRKGANVNSGTGVRGVWFNRGKYKTRVMHNGQRYYVGHYDTLTEAEAAVTAKRLELFSHNDMDRREAA